MNTEWTADDSAIFLMVSCRMGLRLSDVCNLGKADRADARIMHDAARFPGYPFATSSGNAELLRVRAK